MTLFLAPAPVAQIFWPLITQSSPSRRAAVRIAPMSEPASGSDIEIDILISPDDELRQPMALLLLGSLAHQVEPAEDAAAVGHHEIGAGARDLLGDDHHVEDAAAGAAVFLREGKLQQAGFDPGVVELVRIEPLGIEATEVLRGRHPSHQFAHAVAEHLLLGAERDVHRPSRTFRSCRTAFRRRILPVRRRSDPYSAHARGLHSGAFVLDYGTNTGWEEP